MSEKKWVVDLSAEERAELLGLIRKGKGAARRLTRAHILLLADEGRNDEEIAAALHTNGAALFACPRQRLLDFLVGGDVQFVRIKPLRMPSAPGNSRHRVGVSTDGKPPSRMKALHSSSWYRTTAVVAHT